MISHLSFPFSLPLVLPLFFLWHTHSQTLARAHVNTHAQCICPVTFLSSHDTAYSSPCSDLPTWGSREMCKACSLREPTETNLNHSNTIMLRKSYLTLWLWKELVIGLFVNSCSRKHTKDGKHLNYMFSLLCALSHLNLCNNINLVGCF